MIAPVALRSTTDGQARSLAKRFVTSLAATLRALELYPAENDTVERLCSDTLAMLSALLEAHGEVEIRVVDEFVFVNDIALHFDHASEGSLECLSGVFRGHAVGALYVETGVTSAEWTGALRLLTEEAAAERPCEALEHRLAEASFEHIGVDPAIEEAEETDRPDGATPARAAYQRAVGAVRGLFADLQRGRTVRLRRVKRAVREIVDRVLEDDTSILALTALRDYDEYLYTHSVNVCILSILIGHTCGLERDQLVDLGLGGLAHDIGKTRIDRAIVGKAGPLTDTEWQEMKEHPRDGVLALFRARGFAQVPYAQMLIAYEHHMKTDLSGYPPVRRPRSQGFFSRIVQVADTFDAMTSSRSYRFEPMPADQVLAAMRDDASRGLDPFLVKVLICATGVYPVATVVILDTLELGIVLRSNPRRDLLHRPIVKILHDARGIRLAQPFVVDLAELDANTGSYRRSVIKTAEPGRHGIDAAEHVA